MVVVVVVVVVLVVVTGCRAMVLYSNWVELAVNTARPVHACHKPTQTCKPTFISAEFFTTEYINVGIFNQFR